MLAAASLELKAQKKRAHIGPRTCAVVRSVAFSPDGTTIVSGSSDMTPIRGYTDIRGSIKVWDAGVLAWGYR